MTAYRLAHWFLASAPEPLTHLKLQKLCFYGWGIVRALGAGDDLGDVPFEAWQHGPVCPPLWRRYRDCGSKPLERPDERPAAFDAATTWRLQQVWDVYGGLSAWQLRNQSHLERPWIEANRGDDPHIEPAQIVAHFRELYADGPVAAPSYVHGTGSFALDGIAVPRFETWDALVAHCASLRAA